MKDQKPAIPLQQALMERRIRELYEDGFIKLTGTRERWALTRKGWDCLFAVADRPLKRPPRRIEIA